ncbi:sugar-binding transcriptional regulator [Chungangia koreensis]|uniref:Sugar-binding transcriptional regulator n=1 Tax=Chungangia koreensis TaxID=752657 RepID=A0ABV8X6E4_9LACT
MDPVVDSLKKIMPEAVESLLKRYRILTAIKNMGPVGRRVLAEHLQLSERDARKETDLLRNQSLVHYDSSGMMITEDGENVLVGLHELTREWSGITEVERKLEELLNIREVIVVSGDCEHDPQTKTMMGSEAANRLSTVIQKGQTIAVTGGSSVAAVAESVPSSVKNKDLLFIAARGGMGGDLQTQANSIVASIAEKTAGKYRTLFLPDQLSEESYESIMKEPFIVDMINLYQTTDLVIHGIGDATEMAVKRNSTDEEIGILKDTGAVGEAFGYYFNEQGEAVHRIRTVGIQLSQLERVPTILAVAGGSKKDLAILSYLKHAPQQTTLITDEGAALNMLNRLSNK